MKIVVRTALAALVALTLLATAAGASAQSGSITGTVIDALGAPVRGAQVQVEGTSRGAFTNQNGAFLVLMVPAGTQTLRVTHLGYQDAVVQVEVRAGQSAELQVSLETAPIELGGVVVSASRKAERIMDAPATVSRVGLPEIELSVGNSFSGALREVKGIDYIQVGATAAAINARGFNSSFNNRMLMLEDNRVSVLPESGLPIATFTAIPKIDLAGIEVIVGPGAALYGADASNGVLTIQTKDPFQYPGTTVEVTGGTRSFMDVQARHAQQIGDNLAFKVAGEWQQVDDFENRVKYPVANVGEATEEGIVDFASHVGRAEGAVVYTMGLNRFELSGGWSTTDGVGQTNVGRNQFDDWTYNFAQFEFSNPNWFVNVYRNQSQSGKSFAINRYATAKLVDETAGGGNMTHEELRAASDWPSNGRLYAAEVQNNFTVPALLGTEVVWGAQYRQDRVSTANDEGVREWLTDALTGEDVKIGTYGLYAQTETPIHPMVDLILAARYDDHDNYDAQFSPKAGVVVKPAENQAVRLTYNRAFKSPTILQTDFYIPNFVPGIGVFGNTKGWTVRNASDNAVINEYDALVPEDNTTYELGYKGVLGGKLFADVAAYRSYYDNFISPLTLINFVALGQLAYEGDSTTPIADASGVDQSILIYFNLGEATVTGADMGLKYFLTPKVDLSLTGSYIKLNEIKGLDVRTVTGAPDEAKIRELSSINSPRIKGTLGAGFKDLFTSELGSLRGAATVRHVDEYFFASGINVGTIPRFTTLDLSLAYDVERFGGSIMLGVNNLFTCRGDDAGTGVQDECGFDVKHQEMINMPEIGTMLFLGFRYHRD